MYHKLPYTENMWKPNDSFSAQILFLPFNSSGDLANFLTHELQQPRSRDEILQARQILDEKLHRLQHEGNTKWRIDLDWQVIMRTE